MFFNLKKKLFQATQTREHLEMNLGDNGESSLDDLSTDSSEDEIAEISLDDLKVTKKNKLFHSTNICYFKIIILD